MGVLGIGPEEGWWDCLFIVLPACLSVHLPRDYLLVFLQIFDKALTEAKYIPMYTRLCK